MEDLRQFENNLEERSSYIHITDYDYKTAIGQLRSELKEKEEVDTRDFVSNVSKIIFKIGDRHARVKWAGVDFDTIPQDKLYFPMLLANYQNKLIALKKNDRKYDLYNADFPYLTSINGIEMQDFLSQFATENIKAPYASMLTRGAEDLRKYGPLMYMNGKKVSGLIALTLSNTNGQKITLEASPRTNREKYVSIADIRRKYDDYLDDKKYYKLSSWIGKKTGYMAIPKMYSFEEEPSFKNHLFESMKTFQHAENLIIDIRYNKGGSRDIINMLALYIVAKDQSPWVANVAYVRTDADDKKTIDGMDERYLYRYGSDKFTRKDRKAIDRFNKAFRPEKDFDFAKFSEPHYMVLKTGKKPFTGNVYILMNERCFSASSILASAFKGLDNVKLVGVTTDGSSGRSTYFELKNSELKYKISTMISLQRNGKTLDGNGTQPDIKLEADLDMILGDRDTQLERLIEIINSKKDTSL
ncbi:S41 family peptidase [Fulvitalea axinellae]|uniref:S41 family peptidase n=1 Tax=Fulvitalea axinellae TaxID=1182444 RepID=UPI0030CA5058